ncbi:MAG: helix-turn-helix transcriptional regulator [Chloroflexi bacterium]|nr:helix-turn-helix transcriptional regulator [Chloroflexota bacterium]MCC6892096.1 helix-turn-helix transcriptional regulator [Anaerolineae bacterium]
MTKSIHNASYKLLCKLLITRRKELHLSQYDLAEMLNKPQSFIAKIEGGERRIDVLEFLDFAYVLNIDPCEIIRVIAATYYSHRLTD